MNGATASRFGFRLHTRADGTSDREVGYDLAAHTLYGAPLAPVDGRVTVHVLVDRGQLEIFGNGGAFSYTDNVNFDPVARGISLFTTNGSVRLVSLHYNRIATAWGTDESTLDTNLGDGWTAVGGTWTDTAAGKQGTATGDAFYLSPTTAADLSYQGDVRIDSGTAAGLTFRDGYTANVDTTGVVKLWRQGRVIATHATPITAGRTYHLEVVATGDRLRVYLDHSAQPVIDATDTAHASGRLGANVFDGQATVDNLQLNSPGFGTDLAGPWHPVGGTWTAPGTALQSRGAGDTFYLSSQTGTDFTYSADLTPVTGTAAGLVFRADADGTAHYTANVDVTGLVKLWRPGHDIATRAATIVPGRTYHLSVTARGPDLRVSLDGVEVIHATDTTYPSGLFGLNGFAGTARFRDVRLTG